MNLYNEDEKRDGAPVIPSGASSFKKTSAFGKPMFSRTAGGIMERLKNLSRKDMAFVGIGLSVLVAAPVAEYMTSKPSTDNLLTPGFGSREGSAATSGGLYEPGINALSQGSPDGSGEVITPLSSRDPSSLILGAQPAQAVSAPISAPPPSTSFRDSMKDVGRNAFTEVAKSAGTPTPIPRMQSALRNFGSFFSGGEGTRTTGGLDGGKIIGDAKSASSKAASRGMVGPVATAGYKGVASNTPNSSSKSAYDKLRSQADRAASNFSGVSAMNSLDKAASDSIDIGKGSGGLGAGGESEKTTKPSNSTTKYEHSRSGESLEEIAAKKRQEKALEWEFFKKYEIPKQIINALVSSVSTTLGKFVSGKLEGALGMGSGAPDNWACFDYVPQSNPQSCFPIEARNPKAVGAEKEITSLQSNGKCPCGIGVYKGAASGGSAPAASSGGATSTTGGTTVPTGATGSGISGQNTPAASKYQKINESLNAARDFSRQSAEILKKDVLKKEDVADLRKKMLEGVAGNLKIATSLSKELAGTTATDADAIQGAGAEIKTQGEQLAQEAGPALSEVATAENRIDSNKRALLGNTVGKFDEIAGNNSLEYAAKLDAINTALNNKQVGPNGVALIQIMDVSGRARNGVNAAIFKSKESAIVGRGVTEKAQAIPGKVKTAKEAITGLGDFKNHEADITKAMDSLEKPAKPEDAAQAKTALTGKLAQLYPAQEDPNGSPSVQKIIRDTVGLSEEKLDAEQVQLESAWWAQNDPTASGVSKAAAAEDGGSLVRMNNRITALKTGSDSYKRSMDAAKASAVEAKKLAGDASTAMDKLMGGTAVATTADATNTGKPPVADQSGQTSEEKKAQKIEARKDLRAIDACYNATTGFKPTNAGQCKADLATRNATIASVSGRFEATVNSDDADERKEYVGYLKDQRSAAYQWAASCLNTVPAKCTQK